MTLSARVLRANVAIKLVTIAAIVGARVASTQPAPPTSFAIERWPGVDVFVYALIPTLFSYGGFEQILWAAGEIRNPKRNVALGILIGVGVVVVAYARDEHLVPVAARGRRASPTGRGIC